MSHCFLRAPRTPLRLADFPMSTSRPCTRDTGLLAILQTTAMVESRADAYADYLRAVFAPRGAAWLAAIDQWNREERRHGALLQQMIEAADPSFDFDLAMQRYRSRVPYHGNNGISIRGSIAAELVARCVVEALASTYYRVLQQGVESSIAKAALAALAQDEARHYGMFRAMLNVEQCDRIRLPRWRVLVVGFARMLELGDQQIIGAFAQTPMARDARRESHLAARYDANLYSRYQLRHLAYASRLISPVLFGNAAAIMHWPFAIALWAGVRSKSVLARLRIWWRDRGTLPRSAINGSNVIEAVGKTGETPAR